jgi:type I restriction enzyme S subunit
LKYFKKKVYSDDTSNYKVIHRGQFGFPANHVEEGSIGLQGQYDKGIVSPIYVVFSVDESKVDNFFLYKVLKTDHYRQVFAAATSASVDRRGSLRWKPFSSLKISLPSLEEQQAISRVIKSAEREAKLIALELKQLKEEKKALMQQLLTGKRRVKVDEEQSDAVPA